MSSYQSKDEYYYPQQQQSTPYAAAAGANKDQQYEILEAGLVHNVNAGGLEGSHIGSGAAAAAAGWGSGADLEKQLRLGS